MYKIKKGLKASCIILMIIIMNIFNFSNSVTASNLGTVNIQSAGNCGYLLKYKGMIVETYYAEYVDNGKTYPAYCLDKTKKRCIFDKSKL